MGERCAIPAVLYAVEAMLVSDGVVDKLDSIQHQVARFILQLPRSTSKVAGYMDAGFKPMKDRIFFPVYSTRRLQHTTHGREWLGTWFLNWVLKLLTVPNLG